MIQLKELKKKEYLEKKCIHFVYGMKADKKTINAVFDKVFNEYEENEDKDIWKMMILFERDKVSDSQIMEFVYAMPKKNMNLELIAATGLRYFYYYMKEVIDKRTELLFEVSNAIEGM